MSGSSSIIAEDEVAALAADAECSHTQDLMDGHETVKITLRGQRLEYDIVSKEQRGFQKPAHHQKDTGVPRDGVEAPPPTPRPGTDRAVARQSAAPRRASVTGQGYRTVGRDFTRRSGAQVAAIAKISALEEELAKKDDEMAAAIADWEDRVHELLEVNASLEDQLDSLRAVSSAVAVSSRYSQKTSEDKSTKWRDIAVSREAELVSSRALIQNLREQLAEYENAPERTPCTPRQIESQFASTHLKVQCSGDSPLGVMKHLEDEVQKQVLSRVSDKDAAALDDAIRSACLRLGKDWSNMIYRSAGRRVVIPAWNGCYLSFPKAEHVEDEEEDADCLPVPPSSNAWDWPLSRVEKKERAVYVDRQMLMADQRSLMEHIEDLQDACEKQGLKFSDPFPWSDA